jgi:putative membrane protein
MLSTMYIYVAAILSTIHLLALALGLCAVIWRNRAFAWINDNGDVGRWNEVLRADTAWGIAAALWIVSGLARVFFGGQSPAFYAHNVFFWIKMALFAAVFAIELVPMLALLRVRRALRRGIAPPRLPLARVRRIGLIETTLVIIIVFVAALMARGAWLF